MKYRGEASPHRPFLFPRYQLFLYLFWGWLLLHALDLSEAESVHHPLRSIVFLLLRFVASDMRTFIYSVVVVIVIALVQQHKGSIVLGI